jgi:hypothetical protein
MLLILMVVFTELIDPLAAFENIIHSLKCCCITIPHGEGLFSVSWNLCHGRSAANLL